MERGEGGGFIGGLGRRWDGKTREIGKVEVPLTMDMEVPRRRENVRNKKMSVGPNFGKCLNGPGFS